MESTGRDPQQVQKVFKSSPKSSQAEARKAASRTAKRKRQRMRAKARSTNLNALLNGFSSENNGNNKSSNESKQKQSNEESNSNCERVESNEGSKELQKEPLFAWDKKVIFIVPEGFESAIQIVKMPYPCDLEENGLSQSSGPIRVNKIKKSFRVGPYKSRSGSTQQTRFDLNIQRQQIEADLFGTSDSLSDSRQSTKESNRSSQTMSPPNYQHEYYESYWRARKPRLCWNCDSKSHIIRNCPFPLPPR